VAEIGVREAVLSDLQQIAAVARAAGQDEEWGGAGTAYVTHLLAHGRVDAVPAPDGWQAVPATPAEVAALELAWTGVDRSDDHLAWSRRPAGASLLARRGGQVMASGTAGGADGEYGATHLALAPSADPADAVLALLAALPPKDGQATVCLPGPHPAVRPLLAAGWRVAEFDLYMASEPGLLDPIRAVPSPALA
jgi:hypothetical protein